MKNDILYTTSHYSETTCEGFQQRTVIGFQNKCNQFHPSDFKGLRKSNNDLLQVNQISKMYTKKFLILK